MTAAPSNRRGLNGLRLQHYWWLRLKASWYITPITDYRGRIRSEGQRCGNFWETNTVYPSLWDISAQPARKTTSFFTWNTGTLDCPLSIFHHQPNTFPTFRLNVWFLPLMHSWWHEYSEQEGEKESITQTQVCIDKTKVECVKFNPNPNWRLWEGHHHHSPVCKTPNPTKGIRWPGRIYISQPLCLRSKVTGSLSLLKVRLCLNPLSTQNKCKDSPCSQRSTSFLFNSSMSRTATPEKNTKRVLLQIPEIVNSVSHISPETIF